MICHALHEGSHWLIGRLLGCTVEDYVFLDDEKVPIGILWSSVPERWKRLLIQAAPMFMLPLWLTDRGYNKMELEEELCEVELRLEVNVE